MLLVVVLGLTTALLAYLAGSVQTDIKSALSFASLSQVGIIVAEIGCAGVAGWIAAHARGRSRCCGAGLVVPPLRRPDPPPGPRLPADAPVPAGADSLARLPPARERDRRAPAASRRYRFRRLAERSRPAWLYRFAVERGYLDAALIAFFVAPFVRAFRWCDALERRWTDLLSGEASRESDQVKPRFGTFEELS